MTWGQQLVTTLGAGFAGGRKCGVPYMRQMVRLRQGEFRARSNWALSARAGMAHRPVGTFSSASDVTDEGIETAKESAGVDFANGREEGWHVGRPDSRGGSDGARDRSSCRLARACRGFVLVDGDRAQWGAPPANDEAANATVISSLPFSATADTSEATIGPEDVTGSAACGFSTPFQRASSTNTPRRLIRSSGLMYRNPATQRPSESSPAVRALRRSRSRAPSPLTPGSRTRSLSWISVRALAGRCGSPSPCWSLPVSRRSRCQVTPHSRRDRRHLRRRARPRRSHSSQEKRPRPRRSTSSRTRSVSSAPRTNHRRSDSARSNRPAGRGSRCAGGRPRPCRTPAPCLHAIRRSTPRRCSVSCSALWPKRSSGDVMEPRGIEPLTSALRTRRSPI